MRIGSLCAGYGGLEEGVRAVLGGEVAWQSEIDPGACKILAHRYPGVPNIGDMTAVNWAEVEPVDVLCGGTPCQDLSDAGKRAGMTEGTRSNLWVEMRNAIATIRPGLVVWENVRGALSAKASSDMELREGRLGGGDDGPVLRALGRVLGDLADLGYDASWQGLRAADVGAPHGRFRVFVVAWPAEDADIAAGCERRLAASGQAEGGRSRADARRRGGAPAADTLSGRRDGRTPDAVGLPFGRTAAPRGGEVSSGGAAAADPEGDRRDEGRPESARLIGGSDAPLGGAPVAADADGRRFARLEAVDSAEPAKRCGHVDRLGVEAGRLDWGRYGDAVRRWERCLGRPAPAPTEPGSKGQPRLSTAFVEWMMGLPAGWVTDVPGLGRNEQLKALGNGVVPQQAAHALRLLLPDVAVAA